MQIRIMYLDHAELLDCIDLNTLKHDGDIIDWTLDKNSTDMLEVIPYPYVSDIIYRQFNDTHYQWCGPQLYFAEYFAKFTRTR